MTRLRQAKTLSGLNSVGVAMGDAVHARACAELRSAGHVAEEEERRLRGVPVDAAEVASKWVCPSL